MRARSPHPAANIAVVVSGLLRASAMCVPATLLGAQGVWARRSGAHRRHSRTTSGPRPRSVRRADRPAPRLSLARRAQPEISRRSGGLLPQDALSRLLQGTGLRFESLTTHSMRILEIARRSPLPAERGRSLAEVIVTANRREENLQDVPITMQVLTNATLSRLSVTTFEDFASYLPKVTVHGVGQSKLHLHARPCDRQFRQPSGGLGRQLPERRRVSG